MSLSLSLSLSQHRGARAALARGLLAAGLL